MKLIGIAAVGKNRQIGLKGKLPWKNKDELQYFSHTTSNNIIIMGRKTWDSIPKKTWQWRNRKVIVISKDTRGGNKNLFYVGDPAQAILLADFIRVEYQKIFICGGESIYNFCWIHMDEILISEMDYDGPADAYFPEFEQWGFENTNMELVKSEYGDFKIKKYVKVNK